MALDETILAAVANANFKTMAEAAVQDFSAHRARLQILAEKALAKSLESMDTTQPTELDAGAIVAQLQQLLKGAQTTPPPTA